MLSLFLLQKPSWTIRINSADPFSSSVCSKMIQIPWSHLLPTPSLPAQAALNSVFLQFLLSQARQLLALSPPHLQDLQTMACTPAAGVQQRLHQSNFFTKEYEEISWSFARESCLITKTTVKCLVQKASHYSSSKRLCTLEPILSILGHFHIHTRRDSHCCEAAVWKHRGSPLLRIMFLPARNGGTTERQRRWPKLWLGLHVTPWVLSRLPLLQDFLGSLPSCKNSILAPSPTITKELETPNPSSGTALHLLPSPSTRPTCALLSSDPSWAQSQGHQDVPEVDVSHHNDIQLDHEYCIGSNASLISSRWSTSLVSQLPVTPRVHRQKKYTNCFVVVFWGLVLVCFCKGFVFCCPSALSQHIAQCFLYYKNVFCVQQEESFFRSLMRVIVCN